jgi:hypothetical protein
MKQRAVLLLAVAAVALSAFTPSALAAPSATGAHAKAVAWRTLEQRGLTVFAVRCHYIRTSFYSCRWSAANILGTRFRGRMLVRGNRIIDESALIV